MTLIPKYRNPEGAKLKGDFVMASGGVCKYSALDLSKLILYPGKLLYFSITARIASVEVSGYLR